MVRGRVQTFTPINRCGCRPPISHTSMVEGIHLHVRHIFEVLMMIVEKFPDWPILDQSDLLMASETTLFCNCHVILHFIAENRICMIGIIICPLDRSLDGQKLNGLAKPLKLFLSIYFFLPFNI
jgi:hypothetical protein